MKPKAKSFRRLAITQSQAKMYEYDVPKESHLKVIETEDPKELLVLAISVLGNCVRKMNPNFEFDEEYKRDIRFAAEYFDSILRSKLVEIDTDLLLFGASAFYLADFPGSANVLLSEFSDELSPDGSLQNLLVSLIKNNFDSESIGLFDYYDSISDKVYSDVKTLFETGKGKDVKKTVHQLRALAFEFGSSADLIFADLIYAIVLVKQSRSSWTCLPRYSELNSTAWAPYLSKNTSLKELWNSQIKLCKSGILLGKSKIIQFPTSAGKTRSIELVMRSAFLSNRTNVSVIVAPFKALCHEIRSSLFEAFEGEDVNVVEFSDLMETDFEEDLLVSSDKKILIFTPEKLLYVLRQFNDFTNKIGLVVYDEGHQFDTGSRGVAFELLLLTLKKLLPSTTQIVLISAVITNIDQIAEWLLGDSESVVNGSGLSGTNRFVGFANWNGTVPGDISFIDPEKPDIEKFYVPRVIDQYKLKKLKSTEKKIRYFPNLEETNQIGLYLSLKVLKNGAVAIFTGSKISASKICSELVEAFGRGLPMDEPKSQGSAEEIDKLANLFVQNLGGQSVSTQAMILGAATHHRNVPNGLRNCVEFAVRENDVKIVICTSTLAQGVNLPIKYLIVNSTNQGTDKISSRDFLNLMGRAGRSGKFTEGTILFANPDLYPTRRGKSKRAIETWNETKGLLNAVESEKCSSSLLELLRPVTNAWKSDTCEFDYIEEIKLQLENSDRFQELSHEIAREFVSAGFRFDTTWKQLKERAKSLVQLESFMLANAEAFDQDMEQIAKETLAYSIASKGEKKQLIEVFRLVKEKVDKLVTDDDTRKKYGKTMLGTIELAELDDWLSENLGELEGSKSDFAQLLLVLQPILIKFLNNSAFRNLPEDLKYKVMIDWCSGRSFYEILTVNKLSEKKNGKHPSASYYVAETIVDICEEGFSYDGSVLLSAVVELVAQYEDSSEELISALKWLCRNMKYGVSSKTQCVLFEMGFVDRCVVQKISPFFGNNYGRNFLVRRIAIREKEIKSLLSEYPNYFSYILDGILSEMQLRVE